MTSKTNFSIEITTTTTGCGSVTVTPLLQYYCTKEVTVTFPHPVLREINILKNYKSLDFAFLYLKNNRMTKKFYFSCILLWGINDSKNKSHALFGRKTKKHYINIYIHFHEDNAQICCVSMFWDYIFSSDILYLSWQLGK